MRVAKTITMALHLGVFLAGGLPIGSFAGCAPEMATSETLPVGSTVTLLPETESTLKQASLLVGQAKTLLLSVQWNGMPAAKVAESLVLRFFRHGESTPVLETTWQDLVEESKSLGCVDRSKGNGGEPVAICDSRVGSLINSTRIEGVNKASGQKKETPSLTPVYIGSETVQINVLLY